MIADCINIRRNAYLSLKYGACETCMKKAGILKDSRFRVPAVGLGPTRPHGQQILSLSRLPIPTRRHIMIRT